METVNMRLDTLSYTVVSSKHCEHMTNRSNVADKDFAIANLYISMAHTTYSLPKRNITPTTYFSTKEKYNSYNLFSTKEKYNSYNLFSTKKIYIPIIYSYKNMCQYRLEQTLFKRFITCQRIYYSNMYKSNCIGINAI